MEIGRVVVAMTPGALEHGVIVRVGVTRCADAIGVTVGHREPGVIKRGA